MLLGFYKGLTKEEKPAGDFGTLAYYCLLRAGK